MLEAGKAKPSARSGVLPVTDRRTPNEKRLHAEKPYHWAAFSHWLHLERPDLCSQLQGADHDVLFSLCQCADFATGEHAHPSQRNLAKWTGRKVYTVTLSLRRLEGLGLVRRSAEKVTTAKGQKVTCYALCRAGEERVPESVKRGPRVGGVTGLMDRTPGPEGLFLPQKQKTPGVQLPLRSGPRRVSAAASTASAATTW